MLFYNTFESPLGIITIAADTNHLRELHIEGDRYFTAIPKDWICQPRHAILQQAQKEIAEYFAGHRSRFSIPTACAGTPFQKAVWNQLKHIPLGKSLTYGQLATRLDRPKAARAVGTAVGCNPICIIIPCHRVIASDGSLGGYIAGVDHKRYLLEREGYNKRR